MQHIPVVHHPAHRGGCIAVLLQPRSLDQHLQAVWQRARDLPRLAPRRWCRRHYVIDPWSSRSRPGSAGSIQARAKGRWMLMRRWQKGRNSWRKVTGHASASRAGVHVAWTGGLTAAARASDQTLGRLSGSFETGSIASAPALRAHRV